MNKSISEDQLAYIAGIIDTDGCITARRVKNTIRVRVFITQLAYRRHALDCISEWIGIKKGYVRSQPPGRDLVCLDIESQKVLFEVLPLITPYLRVKREQAENATKILEVKYKNFPHKRHVSEDEKQLQMKYMLKIKKLNRYVEIQKLEKLNNKMSDAYLAGLIDGDGSICVDIDETYNTFRIRLYLCASSSKDDILHKFIEHYDTGSILFQKTSNTSVLSISKDVKTVEILEDLLPHLIIKKKKAMIALELLKIKSSPDLTREQKMLMARTAKENIKSLS